MDGHDSTRKDGQLPPMLLSDRDRIPSLPDGTLESVTSELVRRLVRNRTSLEAGNGHHLEMPESADIAAFCDALTDPDATRSLAFFDSLTRAGKTVDTLALRYIASAAELLGKRWERDECSFLEVTLGMARLHGLQRSIRSGFAPARLNLDPELTALFTVTPGDTHVLGVTIAADFFRRAGWVVDLNTAPEIDRLLAMASLTSYSVVGVSVGAYPDDGRLEETISRLRDLQPGARLALGGHVDHLQPALLTRIRADVIVEDVTTAPFSLQTMLISALKD